MVPQEATAPKRFMSQNRSTKSPPVEGEEEVLPAKRRLLVALAIIPAGAMQGTDTFAVSIALPTMMGAMSATITEISWVLTSYLVAGAIQISMPKSECPMPNPLSADFQ